MKISLVTRDLIINLSYIKSFYLPHVTHVCHKRYWKGIKERKKEEEEKKKKT